MSEAASVALVPASKPTVRGWPRRFDGAAREILVRHCDALRPWLRRDVMRLTADELHDYRVALRRLDSALRLLRPLACPALARWRIAVHRVFDALGAVRDLDEQLRRLESGEALRTVLLRRRRGCLRGVRDALRDEAAARWPERLVRLLDSPHCWRARLARAPARPVASALIRRRRRRLRRALRRLDRAAPLADFHRARRRAKRCDDALADFEPWLGDAARPLRRDLGRLRAALGDLQDAVAAQRDFAALANHLADSGLRQRAWELSRLESARLKRARRKALRAAAAMPAAHWRSVRKALGSPAKLEDER